MEFSKQYIKNLFESAFGELIEKDRFLLENGVSERCIVARIAMYVERQLKGDPATGQLHVDVEYNRHKYEPKRNEDDKIYVPDLVIHQRGNDSKNICCCEIKKHADGGDKTDESKIKKQMSELNYQFGVVITTLTDLRVDYVIYHQNEKDAQHYSSTH